MESIGPQIGILIFAVIGWLIVLGIVLIVIVFFFRQMKRKKKYKVWAVVSAILWMGVYIDIHCNCDDFQIRSFSENRKSYIFNNYIWYFYIASLVPRRSKNWKERLVHIVLRMRSSPGFCGNFYPLHWPLPVSRFDFSRLKDVCHRPCFVETMTRKR